MDPSPFERGRTELDAEGNIVEYESPEIPADSLTELFAPDHLTRRKMRVIHRQVRRTLFRWNGKRRLGGEQS